MGARDQYIPEAGAGATSGAVLGSGRGGKDVCGPLGFFATGTVGFGVVDGAGELVLGCLLAMAEVERRAVGRRGSSLPGAAVELDAAAPFGCSDRSEDLALRIPLLRGGSLGTGVGVEDGCEDLDAEADCDLDRASFEEEAEDLLRFSELLLERWPGVWLLEGACSRGGTESSGMSGGLVSVGESWMIFWERTSFDLLADLPLSNDFC